MKRDIEVKRQLYELNWNTFMIWECELSDINTLKGKIQNYFSELHVVRKVCTPNGYVCPEICTPQELMGVDKNG
jgi:G:T-mismatch repair DNA endonuclease (very short patch repair protein)